MTMMAPHAPLERDHLIDNAFYAINQSFDHLPRSEIRRRFGTKLDKGIQYYAQQIYRERGRDVHILDLGCGNGGNRRYLETLGFDKVITVDWKGAGADILVDAHRLPFLDDVFWVGHLNSGL